MSDLMLPPTLAVLLAAFTPCFQARSVVVFQWLILGWMQCQGRRTLTEVALASGAVGERHISVFHRFFSRACWTLMRSGTWCSRWRCSGCQATSRWWCWATTPWRARVARASPWPACTTTRC